jgi:hypothetical protein
MIKTVCLHQFIKSSFYSKFITREGEGNCKICVPDENNKNCKMYYPIRVEVSDIEEERQAAK